MKIFRIILAVVTCISIASSAWAETAEEAVKKAWSAYRIVSHETEYIKIVIAKNNGPTEEKKIVRWIKYSPDGHDKTTVRFQEPAMDKGLGLLTHRKAKDDDQWLKLPSIGSARKISTADQSKYFGGTDFTNEDIRLAQGERTSDYNYAYGERNTIVSTPKPGTESAYAKRLITLDANHAIVKIEYFDKSDHLLKTMTNRKIKISNNGMWRAGETEIKNERLKRTTVMTVADRQFIPIPDSYFTKAFLEK
jgi:hypothetical protein